MTVALIPIPGFSFLQETHLVLLSSMIRTMLTCSLCSLVPRFLSQGWMLDICCYGIQLANFILDLPLLLIVGTIVGLILLINARSFPLIWHSKATIFKLVVETH